MDTWSALCTLVLLAYQLHFAEQRTGESAKDVNPGKDDKNSTYLNVAVVLTTVFLPLTLNLMQIEFATGKVVLEGSSNIPMLLILVMLLGCYLRTVAMRTLGRYFTRTLKVQEGQDLITEGIYGTIRHPGYLANFLVWFPYVFALTSNWAISLFLYITVLWVYRYRISTEEEMLCKKFPQYREYRTKTSALVPNVF